MFRLNRARRVSRWTIVRVIVKSIFVTSRGSVRWTGLFGVGALGLATFFGLGLMTPQHAPAAAPQALPVTAVSAPQSAPAEHTVVIRFQRTFSNSAYRALDMREDALEGTQVTTATVPLSDFEQSLQAYGLNSDESSLVQILEANHGLRFILTAGLDQFTLVTDGTDNSTALVAALKANPLVSDAWLS